MCRWTLQAVLDFSDILANVNRREVLIRYDQNMRDRIQQWVEATLSYSPSNVSVFYEQYQKVIGGLDTISWRQETISNYLECSRVKPDALELTGMTENLKHLSLIFRGVQF